MYAGIDLGGTNIAAGLVDENGKLIRKKSIPLGDGRKNADEAVRKMAELVRELSSEEKVTPERVGIGSPGIVNPLTGTIETASNIAFKNYPLASKMEKELGLPVKLVNDANAAAFGESISGAAAGRANTVMITLGTGVGGGIVIDGKIYTGTNFGAGEIGHMVIVRNGRQCGCGRKGCFEQYASATGLILTCREKAEKYPASLLAKEKEITGRTAFELMRKGDEASKEAVEEYIDCLATGIENIINLFSPDAVIVGGGVSNEGDPLFVPLRERVTGCLFADKTEIVHAALGSDAGIIGAAMA